MKTAIFFFAWVLGSLMTPLAVIFFGSTLGLVYYMQGYLDWIAVSLSMGAWMSFMYNPFCRHYAALAILNKFYPHVDVGSEDGRALMAIIRKELNNLNENKE